MITLLAIFLTQVQASVPFTTVYQKFSLGNGSEMSSYAPSFVTPLYRNLQFRVRDQQVDSESIQKQYTLKFSPLAFGQHSLENELNTEYSKLSTRLNTEAASHSCLSKSQSFLELFYNQESAALYSKLTLTHEDQVTILKKGVTRSLYAFGDLLKAQEKLVESKIALKNFSQSSEGVMKFIGQKAGIELQKGEVDFSQFINIESVKKVVGTLNLKNLEVDRLQSVANIKNLEMEISQKEDSKIFEFVEVTSRHDEASDERAILLEVGFNITPFQKKSVGDYINRQKAMLDLTMAKKEAASEFKDSQSELKNLIKNYEDRVASDYLKDLFETQKFLASSGANSPYNILQVKEKVLEEQIKILELRYQITSAYIDALFYQGMLKDCSEAHLTASQP